MIATGGELGNNLARAHESNAPPLQPGSE